MMVCLIWYHIYRVDFDLITGNSFTHRYLVTWVFCHVPAPGTWYQVPWSLNTKIYTTKDSSKQVHVNLLQIWGKTTDEFGFITVAFIISIVANTIYGVQYQVPVPFFYQSFWYIPVLATEERREGTQNHPDPSEMSCMAFIVQDENKRIEQWCSELVAFNSGPAIDCILYRYYSSAAISLSLHILLLKQTCPSSWTFPINFPNSPLLQTSSRKCWHESRQTFSHSLPEAWLWETRYLELPFWIRPSKLSSPRPMPKSNLHCFMGKYIWFPNGPNWQTTEPAWDCGQGMHLSIHSWTLLHVH